MKAYVMTDVGRVRLTNEDASYLPVSGERFAAVADGMGGHRAGEVASAMAIQVFSQILREADGPASEEVLIRAVDLANAAIYRQSRQDPGQHGMGTTLTGLWFGSDYVYLCHVGDSRAYLLRNEALMQMTNDHSLVNELLERGEITHKEARVHPQRNMITRALGTGKHVISDIIRMDYRPGDCWLLCTDGLSNYLSSSELARILRMDIPWEDKLGSLVEAALQRGGADNITALVIPYEGGIT